MGHSNQMGVKKVKALTGEGIYKIHQYTDCDSEGTQAELAMIIFSMRNIMI